MPNSTSAKKALRQNARHRARNRTKLSALRTAIKKCQTTAESGDATAAAAAFQAVQKKLDQAAAKRLIHPNKAARTKSRLSKTVRGTGAEAPTE